VKLKIVGTLGEWWLWFMFPRQMFWRDADTPPIRWAHICLFHRMCWQDQFEFGDAMGVFFGPGRARLHDIHHGWHFYYPGALRRHKRWLAQIEKEKADETE
jgi:hypothetical protein